ncbi:MAG: hypothetical protein KDH94_06040, partial [Coxiellaceae bacterium]|nr:hypothetical protein [Coxiellaceae bacterium]
MSRANPTGSIAATQADHFGTHSHNSSTTTLINSSAAVLLRLREEYPAKDETEKERDFENCLETLEEYAINNHRQKKIIEHFKETKINEPVDEVRDKATLYDPKTNTYRPKETFTLKEALTLVVHALKDDLKFT